VIFLRFKTNLAFLTIGLPCKHALACITNLRHDIEQYIDDAFKKTTYLKAYNDIFHPVPDISMVDFSNDGIDLLQPAVLKRLPGRPRKNRRLEEGESKPVGATKRSNTVECRNCNYFGYNSRTCQRAPVATKKKGKRTTIVQAPTIPESQASTSVGPATQSKRKRDSTSRNRGIVTKSKNIPNTETVVGPSHSTEAKT